MRCSPLRYCITVVLPALLLSACNSLADDPIVAEKPQASGEESHTNQLAGENSPYLLLHAHNPVDWHPWSEEAFAKAKAENKPIFLSIGYSSCYWCHVMERLVFENEEIAAYMNGHFVNIKVDREERPDVDDLYMLSLQVYFQAVGSPQGGGWPLSMFLTPDRQPFAGGTYFPPQDEPGRPGFLTVLRQVQGLWENRSDDLTRNAEFITREVQRRTRPRFDLEPASPQRSLVDASVRSLTESFDAKFGGFGFDPNAPHGPKFPTPPNLMLLQAQSGREGSSEPLGMLDETLRRMAAGGIRDHLGGGFHRYSVDRFWRVPHFEKMLYDNAQLAEVYAEAYRRTNQPLFREVAEETIEFVLRELHDGAGGFHSALDAETDGVEGAFYVWSPEEIRELLGDERADVFAKVYGLDQDEFFEHGYVLHLPVPLTQAAEKIEISDADLREQLAAMRAELLAKRNERDPLLRDDKVLASWNGLMIRALARAGAALDRPDYVDAAASAARFVTTAMRNEEGRLLHTYRQGDARLNAYLDDYAYLVSGLLALHAVTGDEAWLREAQALTDAQIDLFYDETRHAFFFTPDDHEPLLARSKDCYDSVVPSGNSVAAENLVRLAKLTGETHYGDVAYATLAVFAPEMKQRPSAFTYAALALQQYLDEFGAGPATEQLALAGQAPANPEQSNAPRLMPFASMTDADAERHEKISTNAYLSVDRLPAGGRCKVAVVIDVAEGWHINANPAKPDFMIATELTVAATQKSKLSEVAYPKGEALQLEGFDEALSVYEGRVVLIGTLDVPVSAKQTEEMEISLRYQACNDAMCLRPLTLKLQAKVPVAPAGTAVRAVNASLFEKPREE